MSGKDALLRAGSGSWSSAKALLPVLLRGILSDFSLIMASPHRRRAPRRRHRGIALHADIDGGSAVSSATDRGPPLRRAVDGAAVWRSTFRSSLFAEIAQPQSAGPGWRRCAARRAAGRQMNTQYTHALRFLANFL